MKASTKKLIKKFKANNRKYGITQRGTVKRDTWGKIRAKQLRPGMIK